MKDSKNIILSININDDDVSVKTLEKEGITLSKKDKTLLLIALYQMQQKILNDELSIIKIEDK